MTLYASANPDLAGQIEANYGLKFNNLPASDRRNVLEQMGPKYRIEQVTEDLNNHLVRAQELAFSAYGQASGVQRLETPHLSAMQKMHVEMQHKLEAAHHRIGELSAQVKEHAAALGGKVQDKAKSALNVVKEKLHFGKSEVSGTVPANQERAQEALGAEKQKQWTDRVPPPAAAGDSKVEQLSAQRQQQAGQMNVATA